MLTNSAPHWTATLSACWEQEADEHERQSREPGFTLVHRRLEEVCAKTKRECARQLRLELSKLVNRGG